MTGRQQPPRPAATVILLRDTNAGLEALLLRRNEKLVFAGGYWVFPGGAIDPGDWVLADGDPEQAARHAAIREAREEADIELGPSLDALVGLGRWIGPKGESRRYSTRYFLARCAPDAPITVDGSEILEHRWLPIDQALKHNLAGELPLYPPTWFTLRQLSRFSQVQQALHVMSQLPPLRVLPVFSELDGQRLALFEGDAGYATADAQHDGPRHRLWQRGNEWHYEYSGVVIDIRPLDGRDIDALPTLARSTDSGFD